MLAAPVPQGSGPSADLAWIARAANSNHRGNQRKKRVKLRVHKEREGEICPVILVRAKER